MTDFATASGLPVIDLRLSLPRVGVWHGELSVETESNLTGPCPVGLAGATFNGSVREGGLTLGCWTGRVVAGAGGFRAAVAAKQYREVPLSVPLGDLLREAGETLSRTAQGAVTSRHLRGYVRRTGTAGEAMAALMQVAGASWRVLADGTVWVGVEGWEAVDPEHELLEDNPRERKAVIATETPGTLTPGSMFRGQRVSYVQHQLIDNALRTTVWFE